MYLCNNRLSTVKNNSANKTIRQNLIYPIIKLILTKKKIHKRSHNRIIAISNFFRAKNMIFNKIKDFRTYLIIEYK
jgi:hypothetical protein